jgi:hypothetical protein
MCLSSSIRDSPPEDLELKKGLLLSPKIIILDVAAAKIFRIDPLKIHQIQRTHGKGHGNMNLDELKINKMVL